MQRTPLSFTGNATFIRRSSDDLEDAVFILNGNSNPLIWKASSRRCGVAVRLRPGRCAPRSRALPTARCTCRTPFVAGTTLYYGLFADGFSGSEIAFSDISGDTFSPPQVLDGFPLPGAAGTGGADGERYPVVSRARRQLIYFRDTVFVDSGVGQVGEILACRTAHNRRTTPSRPDRWWRLNSVLGEEPLWLSLDQ